MKRSVLVFGLDGADWAVIRPLIDGGSLPFLASILADGAGAPLQAPWPYATFPSWTSIMTGTLPGFHGMLDFTEFNPQKMEIRFIDARDRRVPAVWQMASRSDRRSVVLGVPGTYPPDREVALMISGFDTPVTTSIEPSFIWPPDMRRPLLDTVGAFPLTPVQELRIGPGWHERTIQALGASIKGKTEVAKFALSRLDPDLFIMVFGESDTVSHHFWHGHDPLSPRARAPGSEFADAITEIYMALDEAMAEITAHAKGNPTVIVVSDHGFGGAGDRSISINRYLSSRGLLEFKSGTSRFPALNRAAEWTFTRMSRSWQQRIFRRAGRVIRRMETRRRFAGVNWNQTAAYSEELNYAPSIRVNLRGRERFGTVDASDYDSMRLHIRDALKSWMDPYLGSPVVERVHFREEIIQGPAVAAAPDLLLELHRPEGYSYVVLPSKGIDDQSVMRLPSDELTGAKSTGMHGSHREEGVFLCKGHGVNPGWIATPVSMDRIAGIIMNSLDLNLPYWIGDPVEGLFLSEVSRDSDDASIDRGTTVPGDRALDWERARRLKGLGYL